MTLKEVKGEAAQEPRLKQFHGPGSVELREIVMEGDGDGRVDVGEPGWSESTSKCVSAGTAEEFRTAPTRATGLTSQPMLSLASGYQKIALDIRLSHERLKRAVPSRQQKRMEFALSLRY